MQDKKPDSLIVNSKEDLAKENLAKAFEAFSRSSAELVEYFSVLQRRIAELTAELERSKRLATIGEMSATLAHEIRNPLSGISLSVSMLKRRIKSRPEMDLIRNIELGIWRMEGIIRNILSFSQDLLVKKERIEWQRLVSKVLDQTEHRVREKDIHIIVEGKAVLFADPVLIERVLVNLLDNSIEAVGDGGSIWLVAESDERGSSFWVRDDGPGFSSEVLEKATEPFFTTKTKGIGLGLAIVSRIVEAHSGTLWLSNWDRGAEVKIWLPF